jgi:hypothetical protein
MTAARLVVAAVVLVAAACQDPPAPRSAAGSAAAGPADAAPPGDAAASGSAAVQHGPPKVIVMDEPPIVLPRQESFRLVDPGKGARTPLRYTLAAGTTAVMARTTLRSRHLQNGDFTAPEALPAIRDGFAVTVAADHAPLALRAVPGQAATASPIADAYLAAARSLADRGIALELDDRGAIGTFRFDDDPDGKRSAQAHDVLAQSLLTLVVPVPAEPVGTGASWRVVSILRQGPAVAKQTATYTLLSRAPRRWKLHVKLQRVGENQSIVDPSLPRGTAVELIALFRALEGDIEVDPALPLIAGGAMTIESRLHAKLQLPPPPGAGSQAPPPRPIEQMVEDTGRVSFTRCRPAPAGARSAPEAAGQLADCAPGYVRAP